MLYKNKLIYGKSFVSSELKTFSNVYVLWLASLLGFQQKKIIRKNFTVNFLKNLQIYNTNINKINSFYKLISSKKKKTDIKKYNAYISNIQNTIIGLSRGFKRKIRLRGIGYKFLLEKNILIFRIGFTHPFTIPISSLLYFRINKKRTKLLFKCNDYNKLTLFLSAFQNIKKPNIYTGKGIRYNLKKFDQKEGKKKKF